MNIRFKIIFVVLPLIVAPLIIMGLASIFTSRNGITAVATEFMRFKAQELSKYAQGQWKVLQDNNLAGRPEFVEITKKATESFARSMIRSKSELIIAVDPSGAIVMKTADITPAPAEARALAALAGSRQEGWLQVRLGGIERVGQAVLVEPFAWYVLVTTARDTFYRSTNMILEQSIVILVIFALLSVVLLILFSGYLTRPLRVIVGAMRGIIASDDLSQRVELLYRDETGELGHTFNLMTGELEQAPTRRSRASRWKRPSRRSASRRSGTSSRSTCPTRSSSSISTSPEAMLVGENRVLAVLFSDIRGFTTISEGMKPDELLETLNDYFARMVDVITADDGAASWTSTSGTRSWRSSARRSSTKMMPTSRSCRLRHDGCARRSSTWGRREGALARFRIGIGINYGGRRWATSAPKRRWTTR